MGDEAKTGYKGRWKKWLLIYLAIAVVAYLIVYLVFFSNGGGGKGGGGYLILPLLLERGRSLAVRTARGRRR
jgi:hypothetical protein